MTTNKKSVAVIVTIVSGGKARSYEFKPNREEPATAKFMRFGSPDSKTLLTSSQGVYVGHGLIADVAKNGKVMPKSTTKAEK
jgi:hypothetical protein